MQIEDVEYEVNDQTMVGRLVVDEYRSGLRPCVLRCHEGPGLDEHVKGRALRLASLGYLAFALDYQGGGQPKEMDEAMAACELFRLRPAARRRNKSASDLHLCRSPRSESNRRPDAYKASALAN